MAGHAVCAMGSDKIRYLVFLNGRWRWRPTKAMRAAGFRMINLSTGTVLGETRVPLAADKAAAMRLNEDWDRHRRGLPAATVAERAYPCGSLGEAYLRVMAARTAERTARGIEWTTEQKSRDDWPRAWKWLEPLFADCDPKTVKHEQLIGDPNRPDLIGLRPLVAAKVSQSEAHRVIKVWRALWKKMAVLNYCDGDRDPSFMFTNPAPSPRLAIWREGEAVRLVKAAWRNGYHGLAACLAVAWDTQLSPVDARSLKAHQFRRDPYGTWFEVARAKTGRAAVGTLSKRAELTLRLYLGSLGAEPAGMAPIFRNRSGAPYSKDTLGDDFRAVRAMVFGDQEGRQLADFRRSGSVEALAGDVQPEKLSAKMANSLSTSNRLHKTYGPVQLASVRAADIARQRGRAELREQKPNESVTAPAKKYHTGVQKKLSD